MSKAKAKSSDSITPRSRAEAARTSPTTEFDAPRDVLKSDDLTEKEKVEVLDQWEADAKALQRATDEGMSGGNRPRLDEVMAAQNELDTRGSVSGDTADREKPTAPIIVTADSARGALGPDETSSGDSLLPMLVGGLVLVVVGLIAVILIG